MKLGATLLNLRKKQRLSQAEVADYIGVSQSTYCAWESDKSTPRAKYFKPLAALFRVSPQSFLLTDNTQRELQLPDLPLSPTISSVVEDDFYKEIAFNHQKTILLLLERNQELEMKLLQLGTLHSNSLSSLE